MPSKPPHKFVLFTDRDLGGNVVPDALEAAGLAVARHRDYFAHDAPDPEIFAEVGKHPDWIMLTKNRTQRTIRDERDAAMRARVPLFIFIGARMTHPEIGAALVLAAPKILRFRERHDPPFIARVYRPQVRSAHRTVPGDVNMWLTEEQWLADMRGR